MKKHALFALAIFSMAWVSCKKDKVSREDFVGTWEANESFIMSGQTQTRTYTFNIILDPGNADRIIINNYGNLSGAAISAIVSGNTFSTEKINVDVSGLAGTFEGSGTLEGNKLTYSNILKFNSTSQTFNGTATKKN